jgi:hypothetical protein
MFCAKTWLYTLDRHIPGTAWKLIVAQSNHSIT